MNPIILKYWQPILSAIVTAGLSVFIANAYTEYRMADQAKTHKAAMAQQEIDLNAQCAADKAITEKVSHEYQAQVSSLNRQLSAARSLYDNACVSVSAATNATGRYDGATGQGKPAGSNAVSNPIRASKLIDLAGEGEQYRIQLIACQSFIRSTWDARQPK